MNGNFHIWNDKSIILDISYLKLEVKPFRLLKELFHPKTQETLDEMISAEYKKIIDEVSEFLKNNFVDQEDNKIYSEILKLSTFIREILPLHSDDECIELTKNEEDIIKSCQNIWAFDTDYGYKTTKTEIKW